MGRGRYAVLPVALAAGALLPAVDGWTLAVDPGAPENVTATADPYSLLDVTRAPRLDGRIIALRASPDRMRIALLIHDGGEPGTHFLTVFDPARRQILSRQALPCASLLGWSPDSRWMAASMEGNGVLLLHRDGQKRTVPPSRSAYLLAWEGERLFYVPAYAAEEVFEYDLDAGRERRVFAGHRVVGLFTVRGAVCAGYFDARRRRVSAVRLADGRRVLSVPLHDRADWDGFGLSVSPDGGFLYLHRSASTRACDVIARAADAATVLREPHKALLFQEDDLAFSMTGVAWHPPVRSPETGSLAHHAIVAGRDGRCRFLLDLLTGSRSPFSLRGARVGFWRQGTLLAATDDGLAVSNLWLPEEVLILHRAR